jgi:hypothetical protein
LVDFKPDINDFPEARFICRINVDFFTKFFWDIIPHSVEESMTDEANKKDPSKTYF